MDMPDFPSLSDHLLIWVFGIILPFVSGLQSQQFSGGIPLDARSRRKLYLGNSLMLALSGTAVLLIWLAKQRSLSALGFSLPKTRQWNILLPVVFLFMMAYLADLYVGIRKAKKEVRDDSWLEKTLFLPDALNEVPAYVLMCMAAGVFEEIIYRGFMITYFTHHGETIENHFPWMALIAPATLFSLAHYYQGWIAVIKIFFFSLLLGLIFILTQSLYPTMVMHFFIDLISGVSAMLTLKRKHEN